LKDLVKFKDKVNEEAHGKIFMRDPLRPIRALVILEYAGDNKQLDSLRGDWYGPGSKILVITLDPQLLNDGLNSEQREMFLDIACLSIGRKRESVISFGEASHCDPNKGLMDMILKSLISLDEDDRFAMPSKLKELPESVGCLVELKHLDLSNCCNLTYLPDTITNLSSLKTLFLSNCHNIRPFLVL